MDAPPIQPPVVSVVIPAWDRYAAAPLADAVASVTAGRVPLELIVVDNASSTPLEVPREARVVRSEERVSVGAARNLGLAHVSAPLVVFLDADDVMLPGGLEALVEGIEASPGVCAHVLALVDGETDGLHRVPRRVARMLARRPAALASLNSVWPLIPLQGATILRTDAVRAVAGYSDREHGEDWGLSAVLAWHGPITFGRRPVLVYRWREDSLGRWSPARLLLANARAVRQRLREGGPRGLRVAMPLVALAQYLAIWVVRPLARAGRGLRGAGR